MSTIMLLYGHLALFRERKRLMFPAEMVILMAIEVAGDSVKRLLNRPTDISGQYITYLYESLVKRGYLERDRYRGYNLTAMGKEALSEFLHENEPLVRELINTIEELGIKTCVKVDSKEKVAVGVPAG